MLPEITAENEDEIQAQIESMSDDELQDVVEWVNDNMIVDARRVKVLSEAGNRENVTV